VITSNALPAPPLPLQQRVVEVRSLLTVPWAMLLRWVLGTVSMPTYIEGTHADRIDPEQHLGVFRPGTLFYETDRTVLYQARLDAGGNPAWIYVSGTMRETLANKPTDLGLNDTGFLFYASDYAHTWRWSVIVSWTDLAIGSADTDLTSAANPFTAAHVGRILDITGGTGFTPGRYVVTSVAGVTATMDRAVGAVGSTAGTGILTGWQYAPGDRTSGEIGWFTANPGTGWRICDGTGTTRTLPDGTTAAFTTPNLIGAYAKGAATYTGAVVAGSGGTLSGTTGAEATHTHAITHDHPLATSGGPGAGLAEVSPGSGYLVAHSGHIHDVDIPTYFGASEGGSAHSHDPGTLAVSAGEPAHVDLLPYFRQ
jgi:hypothetical protein